MRRVICLMFTLFLASTAGAQQAADAYYDSAAMAQARAALKASHGSQRNALVFGERLEVRSNAGAAVVGWEGQGWYGGDLRKLWLKTDGEFETRGEHLAQAELQALYSRAIAPFWELQAGVRHDLRPNPSRSYAVLGLQGLAPLWFELDAALFLSERGDLSVRLEAEYELRFTQRLLLQPRIELNAAFAEDAAVEVGSGVSTAEAGMRLRYEFAREFAPYVGISWSQAFGGTRGYQRAAGENSGQVTFVAGMRFWF